MTPAFRRFAPWLVLAGIAVAILIFRLQLSFDLSAFFPKHSSLRQEVLLEQFRNGPGSRLIVIGINGADQGALRDASELLRDELASLPDFRSVYNGEPSETLAGLPQPIDRYFLLMRDIDYDRDALASALEARLRDLSFAGGADVQTLIARDPYLATLDILQRLSPQDDSGGMWFAADGSAVLMAESRAAAIDIEAQIKAINAINTAFAALPDSDQLRLDITGVGAFSVELQKTIRAEAQTRSIQATIAILLVLLVFYRRLRYLLLAAVPLAIGFLTGLAAVALLFDKVHGITLAFGFTLMGVAIDYPLHLFSHARDGDGAAAIRRIWPTLRLGALSTAVAYLALAFADSDGLAQLGIFTATGILVAVLVTRFFLPGFVPAASNGESPAQTSEPDSVAAKVAPRFWPALVVAAVVLIASSVLPRTAWWDDDLASLSPVPAERLQSDGQLRAAAGTADMRYQLLLSDDSLERLLQRSENLDQQLAAATDAGLLKGWQSLTNALPSDASLQARRLAIPDNAELRARLADVLAGSAFREDAFDPFLRAAADSAALPSLGPEQFVDTALESWLQSHLLQIAGTWVALVSMNAPDVAGLQVALAEWDDGVELVDLKQSSVILLQDYRANAMGAVSIAALLIVGLLWLQRRDLRQVLWIVLTVAVALAVTVLSVVMLHGSLTVIHLVALLLVLGLGLDYALFLSRADTESEKRYTDQAVLASALSTTLAFGVLAFSTIPVLAFLGLTVATGSAASALLAFSGARLQR